jgi:hypothetical protein
VLLEVARPQTARPRPEEADRREDSEDHEDHDPDLKKWRARRELADRDRLGVGVFAGLAVFMVFSTVPMVVWAPAFALGSGLLWGTVIGARAAGWLS